MSAHTAPDGFVPAASLWRNIARRAFRTPQLAPQLAYRYAGRWVDPPPQVLDAQSPAVRLGILIPSLAPLNGSGSLGWFLERLAASLRQLRALPAAPACFVVVALQDRPGAARRAALLQEAEALWQQLGMHDVVPLVGAAVSQPSKILALNACIPLLDVNGATCVAWFDDDVEVLPECLAALWLAFDQRFDGIYGVRKIATPDQSRFSRLWARTKNQREPVNTYPHGCGMLLSRELFGVGIPLQYITDDHYYLFRFLDLAASNPLWRLQVVPAAVVRVPSVNAVGAALGRTARNYRNLQRVLADVPDPTIKYFLSQLHFPGLRLPRSLREALTLRYWRRLLFTLGKLGFWSAARLEVLLRGLLGRPRQTVWFSAPQPTTMQAGDRKETI